MKLRLLTALVVSTLVAGMASGAAYAGGTGSNGGSNSSATGSGLVTATLTGQGAAGRVVGTVSGLINSSVSGTGTSASLAGTYNVTVLEAVANGALWEVDASLTDLTGYTAANLTTPNGSTITADNVKGDGASVTGAAAGTTDTAGANSQAFGPVELWHNTGESTSCAPVCTTYTATHLGSGNLHLAPPSGVKAGVYTGTMTVTIWQ